ncbi:hypothetical protein ABZ215_25220 [Amycolatopsis sp. NPDC006131]|uniref:hypothetical protein n=1 Tax=Amycolatopsis sp. NPDC006131 TaxID=3156731 RepID=UPI0033A04842
MNTPTPEMVGVAWLRRLPLMQGDYVTDADTKLPDITTWTKPTYLQVTHVTSPQDIYSPERNPHLQVDVWGARLDYNLVSSIAETVVDTTFDGSGLGEFAVKAGFYPVRLADVSVFTGPVPIPDDPAELARSRMVLAFTYVINPS